MPSSGSQAIRAYESGEFGLAWDNDISFHVAENAILLRRFRKKSQAEIAFAMGTSQSAVARIESGDDNITLGKLRRLAEALKGRIRFAIEPGEVALPRFPNWWTLIDSGLGASTDWALKGAIVRHTGAAAELAAGWNTENTQEATMPAKELVESAQAS